MDFCGSYRHWRSAISAATLLILAGCSVADYKAPIIELGTAVNDTASTVHKIDLEITKARNKRWLTLLASGNASLQTANNSCASGTKTCSLVIRFLGKDKGKSPFPATAQEKSDLAGLGGLKNYVAGLRAIVDAETASAVTTSANEALAGAAKIETSLAEAQKSVIPSGTIKAYGEPVLAAVKWLVTQYVERVKYKALAAATLRAQPTIEKLAKYHGKVAEVVTANKSSYARKIFIKAQNEFDVPEKKSKINVNNFVKAAAAYNDALKGEAAQPLKKFLIAHTKLNDSLNGDGSTSLADAIGAIKDFAERAKEFSKIVDDINKASDSQAKG
ncbi:MAG: hypothetical protein HOM79_10340 [Alphaproteobacteria bacterium]|jgi:hypothetical protein|nr:hypothetical protein [Alphaproteobacteria bacterium]MBT5159886.1 hypothetical protein [Alphaproteobacteria bacterium]